jgi:hypothetical protein
MTTSADTGLSRSERLDRLPFTGEHGRLGVVSEQVVQGCAWSLG